MEIARLWCRFRNQCIPSKRRQGQWSPVNCESESAQTHANVDNNVSTVVRFFSLSMKHLTQHLCASHVRTFHLRVGRIVNHQQSMSPLSLTFRARICSCARMYADMQSDKQEGGKEAGSFSDSAPAILSSKI
jgi:hypothetical protein